MRYWHTFIVQNVELDESCSKMQYNWHFLHTEPEIDKASTSPTALSLHHEHHGHDESNRKIPHPVQYKDTVNSIDRAPAADANGLHLLVLC